MVVIGGTLYEDNILVVGAQAVESFASVNADMCLQSIWSTDRVVALADLHLVTERGVPDEILDPFRELSVEIVKG